MLLADHARAEGILFSQLMVNVLFSLFEKKRLELSYTGMSNFDNNKSLELHTTGTHPFYFMLIPKRQDTLHILIDMQLEKGAFFGFFRFEFHENT